LGVRGKETISLERVGGKLETGDGEKEK